MKDELTNVLNTANYEELLALANILSITTKDKNQLIIDIDYWTRYYSETAFEKVYNYGGGISYIDILKKVCSCLKLKISANPTIDECEEKMLDYLISNLPEDIKKQINQDINKNAIEHLKETGSWKEINKLSNNAVISTTTYSTVQATTVVATKIAASQLAKAAALGTGKAYFKVLFAKGLAGVAAQKAAQNVALQSAARIGILRGILAPLSGPLGIGLILLSIGSFAFGESYSKVIPLTMMIAQLRVLKETENEMMGF